MARPPMPLEPKQERSATTRRRLLDAAVDELLDSGWAGLTTSSVARRAGVSRGAQQHHFPHKQQLVGEAVHQLAERQMEELRARIAAAPRGRARAQRALDVVFEQYSGPLFAAMVELSLAARADPQLRAAVSEEERSLSRAMHEIGKLVSERETADARNFDRRWATVVSTARGIAMLHLLGHPRESIERQWSAARKHALQLLLA